MSIVKLNKFNRTTEYSSNFKLPIKLSYNKLLRHPRTKLSPQHDNSVNHKSEGSITATYSTAATSTALDVNRVNMAKKRAVATNQAFYKPQTATT